MLHISTLGSGLREGRCHMSAMLDTFARTRAHACACACAHARKSSASNGRGRSRLGSAQSLRVSKPSTSPVAMVPALALLRACRRDRRMSGESVSMNSERGRKEIQQEGEEQCGYATNRTGGRNGRHHPLGACVGADSVATQCQVDHWGGGGEQRPELASTRSPRGVGLTELGFGRRSMTSPLLNAAESDSEFAAPEQVGQNSSGLQHTSPWRQKAPVPSISARIRAWSSRIHPWCLGAGLPATFCLRAPRSTPFPRPAPKTYPTPQAPGELPRCRR